MENLRNEPRVAWEKDLEATPTSLIAADNKLFVATAEGGIYCFGEGPQGKTFDAEPLAPEPQNDGLKGKAGKIISTTGVKSGYCLVLGLSDGRLTEELLKQKDLLILGVDADEAKIAGLRARFDKAGWLGSRIELFCGKPFDFLFPPYIASLIVSENPLTSDIAKTIDPAKLFDRLHPYGGALCFEMPQPEGAKFADFIKSAKLPNAVVKSDEARFLLVREGALPGTASWTHESCDAARTYCSQDERVQAPLGILWYGDHNGFILANHAYDEIRPQVVGGRVFTFSQMSKPSARL